MNKIQLVLFFTAVLLGITVPAGAQVDVSILPETTIAKPDSHFTVCIDVQDVLPEMAVSSIQFTLTFDTCVVFWDGTMTFKQTCLDSAGWHITVHNETYTDLEVWLLGGELLDCDGCILRIGFLVNSHCVRACGGEMNLELPLGGLTGGDLVYLDSEQFDPPAFVADVCAGIRVGVG